MDVISVIVQCVMACKGCAITMQSGFLAPLKAALAHSITQNAAYLGSRDHSVASDGVIGRAPARGP
jgi:hypothetical protein